MQLNISTDYAIRSLLYLATCGRQASSSEISKEMHIPDNYLYAVMGKLKKAGLTVATRGVKGGWTLTKDPADIALLDVIAVMEGSVKVNRCLQGEKECNRDAVGSCPVHAYYCELQDQLECFLGNVTLEQLRDRTWTPLAQLAAERAAV